ncbi:DUF3011 domain-containing protein [Pseudoxanthomonas indica]|uniref:DUF3011 domain-containing protein n=1 Tax=Pseudoxanthomonas indica TaxID=428993 RepID=A0A1T5IPF3_9GAMM|nr:DUF3011 domain-containing protein [Pseudoxanthomonas indica]GGD53457.1 hypothetical protein GCM10007235_27140 [Pseudoxanthomonas indica]SKC41005.1 Protein of unknown function [Pseudoxanthomonas indica]
MRRRIILMSAFVLSVLATQAQAAPQEARYGNGYGNGYGQTLRCESNDNKFRHCPADTRGGVELTRGLSKTWCTEGQNWGWDRNGVWVSGGCRAEFRVYGRGNGNGNGNGGGWGNSSQIIRCDSNDNRYKACAIPRGSQVRFNHQVSKSRCTEGYSWGRERDQVWVSRGCRAEFEVRGGWAGGGNGGYPGHGGGYPGNSGQVVRCDSNDNRTRRCDANIRRGADLQRQVSKNACVQGRTWGWDRGGIWVSGGCRGEFRVW